jgi:hypothetical protein
VVAKADALEGSAAARKMYRGLKDIHEDQDSDWQRLQELEHQQHQYWGQLPGSGIGVDGQQGVQRQDGLGALGGRKARRLGVGLGGQLPTPSSSATSLGQSQSQAGSIGSVQGAGAGARSGSSSKQE